jgi:hypothetical protein
MWLVGGSFSRGNLDQGRDSPLAPQHPGTEDPTSKNVAEHPPERHAGARTEDSADRSRYDGADGLKSDGGAVAPNILREDEEETTIKSAQTGRGAGEIFNHWLVVERAHTEPLVHRAHPVPWHDKGKESDYRNTSEDAQKDFETPFSRVHCLPSNARLTAVKA